VTASQITFWTVSLGLSLILTAVFYPAVKRHAASKRDSFLAAFMASALFSTSVGIVVSAVVHYALLSTRSGGG
jgi:hypothetical protein